jgi:CubicO group peptidase (beta-lactamase class C family)
MSHVGSDRLSGATVFARSTALVAVAFPLALAAQAPDTSLAARLDRVIASAAGPAAPGCAAGVARDGRTIVERGVGLADLEHGSANSAETIFEVGSVSKQFTAASIVLLAIEGKLRLDDPVRKYVPELPDYGAPLTVRHLLNHTSGIRDWGAVLELTGFGRGDRVISQALAIDVITHQRGIDFTPGAEYSYSNSGYTLLSLMVERLSGKSLPAFTAERFFKPLGMTHTQWRDDYRRIVPGRAQAYDPAPNATWRLDMPFMNVYGNGGLLTTAGDLLKWNDMLATRSLGAALVDSMERRGRLNDGREITYALGLVVNTYNGQRQVSHSGATAGYQAYLTRFPDLKLSIAVLCNSSGANPTMVALRLADVVIGHPVAVVAADTIIAPATDLQKRAGLWREVATHLPAQIVVENGALRVMGGAPLHPLRGGGFLAAQGPVRWQFSAGSDGQIVRATRSAIDGEQHFVRDTAWTPTATELAQFAGGWWSDEAGASFTLAVENGQALLRQRPETRLPLRPLYRDHFGFGPGTGQVLWFIRDAAGRVTAMHVGISRTRDMPFVQVQDNR